MCWHFVMQLDYFEPGYLTGGKKKKQKQTNKKPKPELFC